ncbi:hypothetical protein D3C71_1116430 [compost metagenome]
MDLVKFNLLSQNATPLEVEYEWISIEPRKRMVAWMQNYMDDVINRMYEGKSKEMILAERDNYENQLAHHKAIIEEFYNRPNVQELFKGDKINYAKFLMSHADSPRWYNWLLFKAYDFGGLDKVPTWVWREMTYKMKYIKYGRGGKPDSKTS